MTPDGSLALTGSMDGALRLWNLAHRKPKPRQLRAADPVRLVALSDDGSRALAGLRDGSLRSGTLDPLFAPSSSAPRTPPGRGIRLQRVSPWSPGTTRDRCTADR